jgi:Domain of unknown function (DUF6089)
MNKLRLPFFALILLGSFHSLLGQRTSFSLGIGTSYYMGDMVQTMTDMRPGVTFQYNIHFQQNLSLRLGLLHTYYGANDANTEKNAARGLQFSSPLSEGSIQVVWDFVPQKIGSSGREWTSSRRFSPYIFAGVGGAFFNPRVENDNGWTSLQPLGTEGQYIMRGTSYPKPYKLLQMVVPGGLGFRYRVDRNFGIGFDAGYRYTFTDYLDDVSGVYANNEDLRAFSGKEAAFLADPKRNHVAGTARGNAKTNDAYVFASFSLTYFLLKPVCPQP